MNDPGRYLDELSEDLCIEIFGRSPVKSLLRVMCVCKHWYNLIKDPSFIRKHLQLQRTTSEKAGHFLLLHEHACFTLMSGQSTFNHFFFDGDSLANERTTLSLSLQASRNLLCISSKYQNRYFNQFKIDGPVNGLYCLHNQHGKILIWNPTTNEIGLVPIPHTCIAHIGVNRKKFLFSGVVGFGIDPFDEENYKIVLVVDSYCESIYRATRFELLYTTKTNAWKQLVDFTSHVVQPMNNTYLNGFYYWMVPFSCKAVEFDMSENESFRCISTPCVGNLVLFNNRIYLYGFYQNERPILNDFDIWVMTDENNWLKIKSIGGLGFPMMEPLGFWKTENDMLIVINNSNNYHDTQTVLYNTTTREITNLVPRGEWYSFKAVVYYESLVSLNSEITKFKTDDAASFVDIVCDFLMYGYEPSSYDDDDDFLSLDVR